MTRRLISIFVLFGLMAVGETQAQITISAADVSARLALGTVLTSNDDTLALSVNIGALGSTSWNFGTLNSHTQTSLTSVATSLSPFLSLFPGTTHVLRGPITVSGITGTVYQHVILGSSNVTNPGYGGIATTPLGELQLKLTEVPAEVVFPLPFTLGTTWTSTYTETQTITLNGLPVGTPTVTNHTITHIVDAFGPMTLPGGGIHQALRVKNDDRSSAGRTVSYQFVARNGASVEVTAADTLQPNTGTIQISDASWNLPVSTDVRISDAIPATFSLEQNYPNPFNPTTIIKYQIPNASLVTLKVFDVLGREVATLVHEVKSPGTYVVQWSPAGLSSGVYFCEFRAGGFIQTRRLLLQK